VAEAFFGQSPRTDTPHKFVVTVSVPLIYTSSAKLTEQCIWIIEVIVLVLHDFFPMLSRALAEKRCFCPEKQRY
jgi:hypothetical protein